MLTALLVGLLATAIAAPLFGWHYHKIHGVKLSRRASWTYAGTVLLVTTAIAYVTLLFA